MASPHIHEFDLASLLPGERYCPACAGRVCDSLSGLDGVLESGCDLESGTLSVTRDPKRLSASALETAIRRIAVEAADGVAHAAYRITGLD
jgi:copper chaperone CopZ